MKKPKSPTTAKSPLFGASASKPTVTSLGGSKGSQTLPGKSALFQLVKGKKTMNNYAKAGPSIVQNGPNIFGAQPDDGE